MSTSKPFEYARYVSMLEAQLRRPATEASTRTLPVEIRFITYDMPRTGWVWCRSQYEAARAIHGDTGKTARARLHRRLYEGDFRLCRIDEWIVRPSLDYRPPSERGWALLRRAVHTCRVYDYWARQTYCPTAVSHKRRRDEYERGEEATIARYVGFA